MVDLVIATKNIHKVRELRALLKRFPQIEIYSLSDFQSYEPPPETGSSFEENAILKATHAAAALNKWAIGDDSGLSIPALNGAPGIFSHRYAGDMATDKENRKKLLKEMQGFEGLRRAAFFECCLALAAPEGKVKCVRGSCEGTILTEERGRFGFGYDSVFIKHDYHHTFAELEESVKNKISHRAKALNKLLLTIESLLSKEKTD